MKTCKQYRNQAWDALQNNWGSAAGTVFILFVVAVAFSSLSSFLGAMKPQGYATLVFINLLPLFGSLLIIAPAQLALQNALLDKLRGATTSVLETMGENFKREWGKLIRYSLFLFLIFLIPVAIIVYIVYVQPNIIYSGNIFTIITTAVAIIIAVITLMYAMTPFIIHDNPDMGVLQALRNSRIIMKEHMIELFLLALSFIGWILLGILSFGIGMFWIQPYMYTAIAAFYEDIREPQIEGAI